MNLYCRQVLPPTPLRKFADVSSGPVQFSEANTATLNDNTVLVGRTRNDQLSAKSVKVKQTSPPSSDLTSRPLSKKYVPSPPSSSRSVRSLGSSTKVKDTLSSARSTASRSDIEAEREEEFWEKKPSKTVTEQEIVREAEYS